MGWYPCCCGGADCSFCDCFPCGITVQLDGVPPFKCSSSSLIPHDLFTGLQVPISISQNTTGSCKGNKVIVIQDGVAISIPPSSTPVAPPYSCDPCSTSNTTIVEIDVTIYPQANCQVPCTDNDFGNNGICQMCGWQYAVRIKVSPLVAGNASQTYEEWFAVAEQEIDSERCDLGIDEANSSGTRLCFVDPATTYKFQHLNQVLCDDGNVILDFSDIRMTLEPVTKYRNSLGVDCGGEAGCACWWQFNPVSPTTSPCTPTTDPTFVNCIEVNFATGWHNTDYDPTTGAVPDPTPTAGYPGLPCSNMDSFILQATDDTSGDFVPCWWAKSFFLQSTDPAFGGVSIRYQLNVLEATSTVFRFLRRSSNCPDCWDTKGYSCSCPDIWQVFDGVGYPFTDSKFFLAADFLFDGFVIANYTWMSQNSFPIGQIWTSGAVSSNPLKPLSASAGYQSGPVSGWSCANLTYGSAQCTFTDPATMSFPTTRAEEFHCRVKHSISDVTITPTTCPP